MAASIKCYEGSTNGVLELSRERPCTHLRESRSAPRRRWETSQEAGPSKSHEGQQHLKHNHQNHNLFIEYMLCV